MKHHVSESFVRSDEQNKRGGGEVIEGKDVDNQAQDKMKLQDEDTRVRCKQRGQSTFKAKI